MRAFRISALLLLCFAAAGLSLCRAPFSARYIYGRVRDEHGPVAGARVHFQGRGAPEAVSDPQGRFSLPTIGNVPLIAWKAGYRIANTSPGDHPDLLLRSLPANDNDDYDWVGPHPDKLGSANCGNCHAEIYRAWNRSAHARSARNSHFLGLFAGAGQTWNLRREHPLGAGVCATCHAPTFTDSAVQYDLTRVRGVAADGVHCDYCHKIADAPTDKLGTRFGRDGLMLLRPPAGEQFFFGPLDDAVRPGESFAYSPLYKESRYCASCHEGIVFGVHVYGTYSEWLESPARVRGQECQACHMASTGKMTNIAPGKGGIRRDPQTLASHSFPGNQIEMLRRCLSVKTRRMGEASRVTVEVLAQNVGHRVPTGFIDRNLILVVEAWDEHGRPLSLVAGPRLPAAAGKKLAGAPGRLFAKQLRGIDGRSPLPFWLPHESMIDTRLLPGRAELSEFTFAAEMKDIRARLLYRRFWQEVAETRSWMDNESPVCDAWDRGGTAH